jgi:hypothetical protein
VPEDAPGIDLRLRWADHYTLAGEDVPDVPDYVGGFRGKIPIRHDWGVPQFGFGRGGNKLMIPLRILAKDLKLALPYLLGFATAGGPGGTLYRSTTGKGALPIGDPLGLGMVCTGIAGGRLEGPSGYQVLEIPGDNVAPGDGQVYDGKTAEWFGPYDVDFAPDGAAKLLRCFRYAILQLEFEHVFYAVATDEVIQGDPLGEFDRFAFASLAPGIEYVSLKDAILLWETGPQAGEPVGSGGGFVRSVAELKIDLTGWPSDAAADLLNSWMGLDLAAGGIAYNGSVNSDEFTIPVAGQPVTFGPETLLFQPARMDPTCYPTGFLAYNLGLSLAVRPEGWNFFYFHPNGTYQRVMKKGTSDPLYALRNFDNLLYA